ncbi:rhamnosyltransferase subunit B [Terrimicrobium sacchariphilum]|uniref:Rhamnosyltransferase subunit B n=1 Tax=Terrimicrobium sacchariphilum TaxID=690879 RepID=A0A146GAN5_TERSA|nr:glycosyltransferase [Terrimicrobium sacchariphilum]GAT33857.1 rhamnosyltransferase subunit B [Terrimicrobium sacchariphilum]
MRRLRVLFTPFGSEGDVNPLIWIAEGMAARGHEVVFIITPHYQRLIDKKGFTAVPIGTEEQFLAFARNPKAWDPRNGPRTVIKGMVDTIPEAVAAFDRAGDQFDLAILSTLGVAIASLAEAKGIPRIMVHMQPICVRSIHDFPLFMTSMGFLQHTPLWFKRAFFWLVDRLIWVVAERPLNRLRSQLGLQRWRSFYDEGLHGGLGGIAMFPDWFAAPQSDWPQGVRTSNFPVTFKTQPLPPELDSFLSRGEPPIIWTHGSANFDIEHFQRCAIRATHEIGRRCLLVSLDRPTIALPPGTFHYPHVPFENIFPKCLAAVHHGGIGTTSKAVAAGIPQLIIPKSHDQPDNAQRISRLGLGKMLAYRHLDTPRLAATLQELISSDKIRATCQSYSGCVGGEAARSELIDWIEERVYQRRSL